IFFLPFFLPLASKQATQRASFHLSSSKPYRLGGFQNGMVVICYISWRFVCVYPY
ncbi:uncharacterized protein BO87DRAFT_319256, partial [Aspergillus neoniger CBS 115656]